MSNKTEELHNRAKDLRVKVKRMKRLAKQYLRWARTGKKDYNKSSSKMLYAAVKVHVAEADLFDIQATLIETVGLLEECVKQHKLNGYDQSIFKEVLMDVLRD